MVDGVTDPIFVEGGNGTVVAGVAPGGANLVGGVGAVVGVIGVPVTVVGVGADGDIAEKLLVRNETRAPRSLSGCAAAGVIPPAAGSMSSSHAPQWWTESTYAVAFSAFSAATSSSVFQAE